MKTFKQHLNEKTEYYLDPSKDDTEKYVAFDGGTWYTGRVGMKGGDSFLKFVATHGKNSYFESGKLKKVTPKELEKEVHLLRRRLEYYKGSPRNGESK